RRLPLGLSVPEEGQGPPRLLGRPLAPRRGPRPRPSAPPPRPINGVALLPSCQSKLWALGKARIAGLSSHGSFARVPTPRRGRYRPRRQARYRPARLGFGRTGIAPAG